MSRPVSIASSQALNLPIPPKHQVADLFVTNLRLLDLDLRPDWPAISAKAFSTKDAQQNQKHRIRCTEWALYRLFELWDPEDTRDKLQPFFPPLEPLQSLNLRAALYRSLNELKKNGLLGRESILRKTMLDECKGEKLMEILCIFSTAVVRRREQVQAAGRRNAPVSATLATSSMLDAVQQGSLLPLSVAYSASLTSSLRKKEDLRSRFNQLSDMLDGKKSQLEERLGHCNPRAPVAANDAEESQIQKLLHENWPGSSKWPQTVLYGDEVNAGDLPLQQRFQDVWSVVAKGGRLPADQSSVGLLESLERRVSEQTDRLRRWHDFHNKFTRTSPGSTGNPTSRGSLDSESPLAFKFSRHRHLRLGSDIPFDTVGMPQPALVYQTVLATLMKNLSNASRCKRDGGIGWTSERGGDEQILDHAIFSPVKASTSQSRAPPIQTAEETQIFKQKAAVNVEATSGPAIEVKVSNIPNSRQLVESKPPLPIPVWSAVPTPPPTATASELEQQQLSPQLGAKPDTPPISSEESSISSSSDEEDLADQIISSVVNAAPSPVKPPGLTLADRTRMTMAAVPKHQSKLLEVPPPELPKEREVPGIEITNRRATLLERTRQSMSHVPAHNDVKSKKHIRKSSRQSLFPVNQFETPGRTRAPPPDMKRDATPTEILFSEDAEYTSVFKSRPKIALSPVWSPEEPSVPALEDCLESDDSAQEETWGSSPLARRGITNI